ncbi:hypothetical protein LCGC14_0657120 [marine sediment metagenome]|uniref:Uncharacterized protein n=1 Tax=marine sediment metagenome TaxID=412755 RepID=A0A0F9TGC1_9ZZZZ
MYINKVKEYLPRFCVSLLIVLIGTNLVLFFIGKLGEGKLSLIVFGLIYLIFILPISISLTHIGSRRTIKKTSQKIFKTMTPNQKESLYLCKVFV